MYGSDTSGPGSSDYQKEIKRARQQAQNVPLKPKMGAIAFFDMPGSTRMMKQSPRTAILAMLRHNAMCRVVIEPNGGKIVKELGDGLMVQFINTGEAVGCAAKVIQNLRKHGGGICTKAAVAFGTLWDVENPSGNRDVYGTPVHVCARMSSYAVKDAILIDGKDKEPAVEWLEPTGFTIRRMQKDLKDYPGRQFYMISLR